MRFSGRSLCLYGTESAVCISEWCEFYILRGLWEQCSRSDSSGVSQVLLRGKKPARTVGIDCRRGGRAGTEGTGIEWDGRKGTSEGRKGPEPTSAAGACADCSIVITCPYLQYYGGIMKCREECPNNHDHSGFFVGDGEVPNTFQNGERRCQSVDGDWWTEGTERRCTVSGMVRIRVPGLWVI